MRISKTTILYKNIFGPIRLYEPMFGSIYTNVRMLMAKMLMRVIQAIKAEDLCNNYLEG